MKSQIVGLALLAAGLAACGSPPVAKSNPTWEADVYPILQGQCLHCHGQDHDSNGQTVTRFDFFDLSKCGDISFVDKAPSISVNATSLKNVLFPDPDKDADTNKVTAVARSLLMPPPPATSLEDWQITTIKNWVKITDKEKRRGSRGKDNENNHKPKIIITSKLPNDVGDALKVSYRFEDTDGDPVIGVLKLGDAKVDLLKYSGEVTLMGISGSSGDKLTLSAEICDGWQPATQNNLGEIKRQ
jgi:hypothetical protein